MVTLHYLQKKNCLIKFENKSIECENNTLRNIGKAELENDAILLQHFKNEALLRTSDGHYDVRRKLLRNLRASN